MFVFYTHVPRKVTMLVRNADGDHAIDVGSRKRHFEEQGGGVGAAELESMRFLRTSFVQSWYGMNGFPSLGDINGSLACACR